MLFVRLNAGRRRGLAEEIAVIDELPERPVVLFLTGKVDLTECWIQVAGFGRTPEVAQDAQAIAGGERQKVDDAEH